MVAVEEGREVIGDWMFGLFRRQHLDKFLSSFEKLGLSDLPHAVACARYHTVSNGVGGVRVEYSEESDTKAWVRFRYPRWMYDGPAICGIPVEASRGFLKGWYAHNGVSLENPRLGFVCVSEDLTAEFGLCGYFKEYEHELSDDERLQFARDEIPPPFDPADQPQPPTDQWSEERLAKAARNYAMEYCRNAIPELAKVVGRDRAVALGKRAARLTGLQQYQFMAESLGFSDGGVSEAAQFLALALTGMGDSTEVTGDDSHSTVRHHGLRIVRDMATDDRADMLSCWTELWRGALAARRQFSTVDTEDIGDALIWTIKPARPAMAPTQ